MTRAEMRQMARQLITYDLEGVSVNDDELNALLQQGNTHTAYVLCMPVGTEQVTVPALSDYVRPASIVRVYEAHWKDTGGGMSRLLPWAGELGSRFDRTGSPQYYIWDGSAVRLLPIPDQQGYLVLTGVKVSPLASDSDEPGYPKIYHVAPVYYAVFSIAERYLHPKAAYFRNVYNQLTRTAEHVRQQLHAHRGEPR